MSKAIFILAVFLCFVKHFLFYFFEKGRHLVTVFLVLLLLCELGTCFTFDFFCLAWYIFGGIAKKVISDC